MLFGHFHPRVLSCDKRYFVCVKRIALDFFRFLFIYWMVFVLLIDFSSNTKKQSCTLESHKINPKQSFWRNFLLCGVSICKLVHSKYKNITYNLPILKTNLRYTEASMDGRFSLLNQSRIRAWKRPKAWEKHDSRIPEFGSEFEANASNIEACCRKIGSVKSRSNGK